MVTINFSANIQKAENGGWSTQYFVYASGGTDEERKVENAKLSDRTGLKVFDTKEQMLADLEKQIANL